MKISYDDVVFREGSKVTLPGNGTLLVSHVSLKAYRFLTLERTIGDGADDLVIHDTRNNAQDVHVPWQGSVAYARVAPVVVTQTTQKTPLELLKEAKK